MQGAAEGRAAVPEASIQRQVRRRAMRQDRVRHGKVHHQEARSKGMPEQMRISDQGAASMWPCKMGQAVRCVDV